MYHFWPQTLASGFVGVDVFFVISGYLVGGRLLTAALNSQKLHLLSFYARRAKRILPAAYITVILSIGALCFLAPMNRWEAASREVTASVLYVQNILLARDSVDYLAQDAPDSMFRHFWSLSVEEQFYIAIPVVIVLCGFIAKKLKLNSKGMLIGALLLLTAGSFAWSTYQVASANPTAYFMLTSRFWEMGVGALLVLLPALPKPQAHRGFSVVGWMCIVVSTIATDPSSFPGVGALPAVLGTAMVIYGGMYAGRATATAPTATATTATAPTTVATSKRGIAGVRYLGDISYNLYLVHWPILIFLPLIAPADEWWTRFVAVACALVLAAALYNWVDRPLRNFRVTPLNAPRILFCALGASILVIIVAMVPAAFAQHQQDKQRGQVLHIIQNDFDRLGLSQETKESLESFSLDTQTLLPLPSEVRDILPTGAEGRCKGFISKDYTPVCSFGSSDAELRIALAGDSHTEHYLPAFEKLVRDTGTLYVDTYFHASCPLSSAQRVSDNERGGPCMKANEQTRKAIIAGDYDLVITSNRTDMQWMTGAGMPSVEDGFIEVWSEFVDAGKRVVVLRDSPMMLPDDATTECVIRYASTPEKCARTLEEAQSIDRQIQPALETDGVFLVDPTPLFCQGNRCPAVVGNVIVYRDQQHVSVLYAETLGDELWAEIDNVLKAG